MKYCCETCGKTFNSEEKCIECEKKHEEERAKQECLKKEQESRWKEVEEAYKKAEELRKRYVDDYKVSSFVTTCPNQFMELVDRLLDTWVEK